MGGSSHPCQVTPWAWRLCILQSAHLGPASIHLMFHLGLILEGYNKLLCNLHQSPNCSVKTQLGKRQSHLDLQLPMLGFGERARGLQRSLPSQLFPQFHQNIALFLLSQLTFDPHLKRASIMLKYFPFFFFIFQIYPIKLPFSPTCKNTGIQHLTMIQFN